VGFGSFVLTIFIIIIWFTQTAVSVMTSPTTSSTTALDVWTRDGVKFGKELREKEFMFQKGFLNLNHGEFLLSFSL
jgi:hypothetical protein